MRRAQSGWIWLGALVAAALGITTCACDPGAPGRVLLIGLDGATLRVARPLLEAGRLPNLARLAREGASAPLHSLQPLLSPRIWNSIATGKTPEKHGILDFVHPDGRLFTSHDRKVHALWNMASEAGLSVAVINWWNTHPVERVRGVMVSDHLFPREAMQHEGPSAVAASSGALVFPEDWQPRLSSILSGRERLLHDGGSLGEPSGLPAWMRSDYLSRLRGQDAALARLALEIEAETHPDLLMLLLTGIDRASHVLWIGMESSHPYPERLRVSEAERSAARAALEAHYELADALVGRLLERYGPDDLVMVVSDHGFEAGVDFMILTGVHWGEAAAQGVLFARGPGIAPGDRPWLVTVLDVTPTILAWLELPIGADMDGRPAPLLRHARVRTIPSWDGQPVDRLPASTSGAEKELLRQLRELGYVE